jgi:ribosome-binding ATPase YchF (GTP1/OBG family)
MVIGCSSLSKIEVPEELLAEGEDDLRIHYFYEDANAAKEPDEQALQATTLHNVRDETVRQKADAVGLTRFPMVVLVNDKEIALKTDDLNDVIDFLKKNRQGS